MVDNSLTSLKESIRAFRQRFDLIQSSPVLTHLTPSCSCVPNSVSLPRFSGDNPTVWVLQAEKYFVFHNILSEHKLSLASFYFDGEALEWYRWLFRNKQLAGWDHFMDKLLIHFRSRPRDKQREFLPIPRNKNHRAVDYSQANLNEHSNRNNQSLAHTVFKEMSDKETNVETMGLPAIQVCHFAEHDNTSTSLEIQYDVLAGNSEVDHMFDKMPEKKIDMEVEHPVINDLANLASHMFDEIFQTVSTFKGEYGDLLMFDDNFLSLPCWTSVFSRTQLRGRSIFDYFREFDHANLPLSLYRFPPDQFEFSFPFDPGSSLLPVFLTLQTIIYAWLWMFSRRSLGYSHVISTFFDDALIVDDQ
ncbi:hypothetical protein KY289_031108 [Solanum tuberosum]|nr:hypothetical protein KY284_030781 [Solanum tuberosum]KAH0653430.1 hypothetical protein KY289_031108 [Solanum tuberosum]